MEQYEVNDGLHDHFNLDLEDLRPANVQKQEVGMMKPHLPLIVIPPNQKPEPKAPSVDQQMDDDEKGLCIICMSVKINTVFYRCGHMCCCLDCSFRVRRDKCPICRQLITDVIRTYIVT